MPLLEETGYVPKHRYAYGTEIREHVERIAKKWNIQAQFGHKITGMRWGEPTRQWEVSMLQNHKKGRTTEIRVKAQFVMPSFGIFPIPQIPKLAGFNEMRRNVKILHSTRWDYELTGGTQAQPDMSKLKDKVVGIVGTGATAVQIVPQLAKSAKHLYVFQRTPSFVGYREQSEVTEEDWKKTAYKKGWQAERMINFDAVLCREGTEIDLVNDGWTRSTSFFALQGSASKIVTHENLEEYRQEMVKLDLEIGEKSRAYIASQVHDPITASKLQPWYYGWCKRPTFHDEYLSTFNRDNVTLVDLDGKGLEKCTPFGPVVNGTPYDLDVLVFATGFFTGLSSAPGAYWPFPIIGRDGKSLETKFRTKEFATLHGIMTGEFPNLFVISPRGGAVSTNFTSVFDIAAKHIAYILRTAFDKIDDPNKIVVEPTKEAEEGWGDEVAKRAGRFSLAGLCTPGYMTGYEDVTKTTPDEARFKARGAPFGGGFNGYRRVLEEYQQSGGLPGIVVSS